MSVLEFKRNSLSKKIEGLLSSLEAVTKTLKIQSIGKASSARKLVISTNWLNVFDFPKGAPVCESVIGENQGLTVSLADEETKETKIVYSRSHKNRDDETLMDIRSQKKINKALGHAEFAHIIFTKGLLTITPIFAAEYRAINTGLKIVLGEAGISFTAIIDALDSIRDQGFAKIIIEVGEEYKESHEYTLFQMQIRRMGYSIEIDGNGRAVATLGSAKADKIIKYTSLCTPAPLPTVFNHSEPLSTFSAMTAGVDISGIEQEGFIVNQLIETRPCEKRDYKKLTDPTTGTVSTVLNDISETGAICAAINSKAAKVVFNEDIYKFDLDRVASIYEHQNFLQISLTCTDFSNLKNKADKKRHIESLQSTCDMIFPALDFIRRSNIPTLLLENVKNFANSHEAKLLEARLTELGYKVHKTVLNAANYNGYTKRERCFIFATKLTSDFQWPQPVKRTAHLWRDVIEPNMHMLRDVSHTKTVKKAIASGRLRCIDVGDDISPTIFRAQNRQLKDSTYVRIDGRFYMPNNDMLKMMMGISLNFNLSLFSTDLASEFIGQSCCLDLHKHLAKSVKAHIMSFASKVITPIKAVKSVIKDEVMKITQPSHQLSLFG